MQLYQLVKECPTACMALLKLYHDHIAAAPEGKQKSPKEFVETFVHREKDYKVLRMAEKLWENGYRETPVPEEFDVPKMLQEGWWITSVKRLFDNVTITVGEDRFFSKNIGNQTIVSVDNISLYEGVIRISGASMLLNIPLSDIEVIKPVLRTQDGYMRFEGERVHKVDQNFRLFGATLRCKEIEDIAQVTGAKYFRDEDAAKRYVMLNEPKISVLDFFNYRTNERIQTEEDLISKLNEREVSHENRKTSKV